MTTTISSNAQPRYEFSHCPSCGSLTTYRESGSDRSLVCTKCDWEAVRVVWVAAKVEDWET